MTTACATKTAMPAATLARLNERVRRLVALHFHPRDGAAFWIERARALGVDALHAVHSVGDCARLGTMTAADLCERPLCDYIPRTLHHEMPHMIVGQTGGTTGGPAASPWTAYRRDEFEQAFVRPFHVAARHVGFPRGGQWLYVGPSGPHVIGKVVAALASGQGAMDPFSVDFDPRWAKRLPEGSFAAQRYLDHVVEQAMAVIQRQQISVIFTTPVVLAGLAAEMSDTQRAAIRGVHYGGMALSDDALSNFQSRLFPGAVHLSGYGNTLFGCCLELDVAPDRVPTYFPFGDRLLLDIEHEDREGDEGRVRFTRLDETMLIVNMLERDVAQAVAAPANAPPGFDLGLLGVRQPRSPRSLIPAQRVGLY